MKFKLLVAVLPLLALCASCGYSSSDSSDDEEYDEECYDDDVSSDDAADGAVMSGRAGGSEKRLVFSDSNAAGSIDEGWPSSALIAADLTGHSLSEGVENGYHRSDWTFKIEYGDVSDLTVLEELTNTDSKYLVIVSMKLSKGGNFHYLAKARVNYVRGAGGSPELDYVTSLGMRVVSDGEFDDAVTLELGDDGWGGVTCLQIRNKSEMTLVVGGQIRNSDGWHKFSRVVDPYGKAAVGGTFSGGSVTDYRLDFVVREK